MTSYSLIIYELLKPTHFRFQVIVLISSDSILATSPDYISTYENIIFAKVNFSKLVADTSVSNLWESHAVTGTGFYQENISDVLRIVVALKFGGVYLDSDVISVKPLPDNQGSSVKGFLVKS